MKRIICIIAAMSLALGLCSCGADNGNDGEANKNSSQASTRQRVTIKFASTVFKGYEVTAEDEYTVYTGTEWVDNEMTAVIIKPDFTADTYAAKISDISADFTMRFSNRTEAEAKSYAQRIIKEKGFDKDEFNQIDDTADSYMASLYNNKSTVFIYFIKSTGSLQISLTVNNM